MTDRPEPAKPAKPAKPVKPAEPAKPAKPAKPAEPANPTRRRRVRRRAERPGTLPSADDAPDVVPPRAGPRPGQSQHDRWLREQRPPHWE